MLLILVKNKPFGTFHHAICTRIAQESTYHVSISFNILYTYSRPPHKETCGTKSGKHGAFRARTLGKKIPRRNTLDRVAIFCQTRLPEL